MKTRSRDALWYFAYGSNMNRSIFCDRRRMYPLAVCWGRLENYCLCFNLPVGPGERGAANVERKVGARICGVLYLLTSKDFARLDRTEGVHRGVYRRIPVEVLTQGEERISAWTYQSSMTKRGRKPSARYLGLLVDGARQHELPREYVSFLEDFELAWDEREGQEDRAEKNAESQKRKKGTGK